MTNNRLLEKLSEQAWLFTNSKCQAISFLLCGNVWKHSTQGKYNYEGVRAKMRNVSVSECILKNLHVKVIVFIKWAFFAWKIFIILKWWADFTPSLLLEMCSRARSHMILSGDNKRNQTCFLCLEEKAQRGKSGWFVDLSKRLVQFSLCNCHGKLLPIGFKLMWTAKLR